MKALIPQNELDEEVKRVVNQMKDMDVDSESYRKSVDNLKVLCEARGVKSHSQISTDVIVTALTNIIGILLVLNYEKANVITSKAISFMFKGGRG